jgi:hypothetical protein
LGVRPGVEDDAHDGNGFAEFYDTVMHRAWEIMREQEWIAAPAAEAGTANQI